MINELIKHLKESKSNAVIIAIYGMLLTALGALIGLAIYFCK